ncbi:MAG: histidine kinase dimerization/phospho-acceptor domain-containing protein, partial [Chloroflexota bacterium]
MTMRDIGRNAASSQNEIIFAYDPGLRRRLLNIWIFSLCGAVVLIFLLVTFLVPTDQSQTDPRMVPVLIFGLIGLVFAFGYLLWLITVRNFIRPMEQLVDISEAIRWRGYLQDSEKERLKKLGKDRTQIGILARSLMAMESENNRRFTEMEILLKNSQAVASTLDANEVISTILEQLQLLFSVEQCALLTLDQRRDIFQMVASQGMGDYADLYNNSKADPNQASYRALRSGRPVQIADVNNSMYDTILRGRAEEAGFRSILAIPLWSHHAAPSVLVLYKNQPYNYSYSELELAVSFANHASMALENAALFSLTDEQLQSQKQQMEAIVESMRDGLILENLAGQIIYANQQAAEFVGLAPVALMQKEPLEVLQAFGIERPVATDEYVEIGQTHPKRDLRITFFDVTNAAGQLIGRGQVWQDITHDRELDRMKSTLISTVSHELRTPLASIKGYASTLLAEDVSWDAQSQKEFIRTISDEADRLTQLIRNLLDMSRIEGGTLKIDREPHDLTLV